MKTKIPEQYLTDYALNELAPEDRIYVESLLGASEEAREDVYQMIDLAMSLDQGFEREDARAPEGLTAEQRERLLDVRLPNVFLRRAAVVLAAAASVALAVVQQDSWMPRVQFSQPTAAAGTTGPNGMHAHVSAVEADYVTQLVQFPEWARDPLLRKWFSTNLSEMFSESGFDGMPGMPGMPMSSMPLD
jgi:anti-sigma factor RsiW